MRESSVSQRVQLEAAAEGVTLLRNNNGAAFDKTGRLIRYGLGHVAPDQPLRSSDLIGWTPMVITPAMVGKVVAVFTAVEVKTEGWKLPTDEREKAQAKFLDLVRQSGGLSTFATSVKDVLRLISLTRGST
jgi:hypothetical protein